MNYFSPEGHLNDSGIALYADAIKLNKIAQLPDNFKSHVDSCTICQHQLVDFSAIMTDVDQSDIKQHPYFDKNESQAQNLVSDTKTSKSSGSKIRPLLMRIAVAAVFAALTFFAYKQFSGNQKKEIVNVYPDAPPNRLKPETKEPNPKTNETIVETPKPSENKTPKANTPKQSEIEIPEAKNNRELFAANFIPNEEYESILGNITRSAEFKVTGPINDVMFREGKKILFKWENNIKLNFTIFDNEEEVVFVKSINSDHLDFQNNLKPGVYYWKLETEKDLLHLGKFTVE